MKKICLAVLSAICGICAAFGVMTINNTQTVKADTAVTLSATKIMKSTAQDKMLLATAITGVECVYEVGYTGLTGVQTISAETTKYYTDITTGEKTWAAEEIFGEDYADAGLIVWEIEYDPTEDYTFQAYAKYGEVSEGEIVMNDPETIKLGTERELIADRWVAATEQGGAAAFAVLKNTSSWGSHYHGWPYLTGSDATSVWTNACRANSTQVGFTWTASAINAMIAEGVRKISFNVTAEIDHYIVVYLGNEATGWIEGEYVNHPTYTYMHYFKNGAKVTVDLEKVSAQGQDLNFALTPDLTWNVANATQCKVKFTNIEFEKMSKNELEQIEEEKLQRQSFAVLQNTSSWGSHYHGYPSSTGADATSVWTTAMAGNGLPGFTWTKDALNQIIDVGCESITFTVTTANGAHVAIYFTGDYGYNWIGGDVAYLNDTTYYFASGARVTIGLKEVMDNLGADGSYPTAAIKFVLTNGTQWTAAPSQKVTFSNFEFAEEYTLQGEELTAEERALKLLNSQNAYDSHYHGTLNSVTVNENSVTLAVSKGAYSNSVTGFMIKRSVISNLYRIGIDKLSFKVEASASYIGLYFTNSYKLTYASGYQSVVEGNTDCTYYYASGSTVTIDIVALIGSKNFANGSGDDGIKMLVMQSASWDPVPSMATVTLSNFSVEEFTFENANKLTLVTTTGDFYGSYDSGSYFCGDLAADKAVLQLMYNAGFRYVDLSMYSFNSSSDYMQADWRTKIAELKAYATSLGMTFVQAHAQGGNGIDTDTAAVNTLVQQTIRQIEICGELGIKNIVVHAGWRAGYTKAQWFEANKAFYEKLLPTAASCGVNVLCENSTAYNMGNNYYINTGADMREFIEYVNHPNFHGCWDTGHANCEGEQYDDIIALGDEMYAIHFAENMGVGDTHVMPYFGNLKVDSVMRALKEIGFDGYFTFECDGRDRMNGTWRGPEELDELVAADPSLMSRLEQEKLLYAIGEYILRTYGMLEE